MGRAPGRTARLTARIDALPPSIRPAVFGALLIVFFAMTRGALLVLPVALICLFAVSAHPWTSLATGMSIVAIAMAGGALSGLAYGLVGRHLQRSVRGGQYLTGIVTAAPYMLALTYVLHVGKSIPFWHRLTGAELAISGIMTLLGGAVLGLTVFGADDRDARTRGDRQHTLRR